MGQPPSHWPLTRQCELAGVARSTVYAPQMAAKPDEQELALVSAVDARYTRHPFYANAQGSGSRKMRNHLRGLGRKINRKRVQRLMGLLGLAGMAPGPNTRRPHPQQGLSVSAQRRGDGTTQPGVGHWHYVCPPDAGVCVLGGSD